MTENIVVIFIAFLLAGWTQGVIGFGFAVVTTLVLINRMDFTVLVFFNLCMSVLTSLIAMVSAKNLRAIHKETLLKLISSAALGLFVGLMSLSYINPVVLKQLTLAVILAASVLSLSKVKAVFSSSYLTWIAGFFSGVLTPGTGINGPLVALHLNAVFDNKEQIRSTMLSYLFLIMLFGSISMGFHIRLLPDIKLLFLKVIPPTIIGYGLGLWSFKKLSHQLFIKTVTVFLILSSVLSLSYLFFTR